MINPLTSPTWVFQGTRLQAHPGLLLCKISNVRGSTRTRQHRAIQHSAYKGSTTADDLRRPVVRLRLLGFKTGLSWLKRQSVVESVMPGWPFRCRQTLGFAAGNLHGGRCPLHHDHNC